MSIKIMNAVWENAPYEGPILFVLLALADWANDKADNLYPTIRQVMHKSRLGETAVRDCLKRLTKDGVLKQTEWATGKPGIANRYALDLDLVLGWKSREMPSLGKRVRPAKGSVSEGGEGFAESETGSPEPSRNIDKPPSNNHHSKTTIGETDVSQAMGNSKVKAERKKNSITTMIGDYRPSPEDRAKAVAYWTKRGRTDLVAQVDDQAEQFWAHHTGRGSRWVVWPLAWQTWYSTTPMRVPAPRGHAAASFQQTDFEDTDEYGWVERMRVWRGETENAPGLWHPKWGPQPDQAGCRVPEHIAKGGRARVQ